MTKLACTKPRHREQANFAGVKHSTLKYLDPSIYPDKPQNFREAMKALDKPWAEAYNSEYLGFVEQASTRCILSSKAGAWRKNPRHAHKA